MGLSFMWKLFELQQLFVAIKCIWVLQKCVLMCLFSLYCSTPIPDSLRPAFLLFPSQEFQTFIFTLIPVLYLLHRHEHSPVQSRLCSWTHIVVLQRKTLNHWRIYLKVKKNKKIRRIKPISSPRPIDGCCNIRLTLSAGREEEELDGKKRVRLDVFLQTACTSRSPTPQTEPQPWVHYVAVTPEEPEEVQVTTEVIKDIC